MENTTNIPLKTYNVTKVDARPKLSGHHKILFDDKKISIPWEEGKTSHLYEILYLYSFLPLIHWI